MKSNTKVFGVPILGIGLFLAATAGTAHAQEAVDPPFWDPSSQPPNPESYPGGGGGGGTFCFSCYSLGGADTAQPGCGGCNGYA